MCDTQPWHRLGLPDDARMNRVSRETVDRTRESRLSAAEPAVALVSLRSSLFARRFQAPTSRQKVVSRT
jgi:hypothetical protein